MLRLAAFVLFTATAAAQPGPTAYVGGRWLEPAPAGAGGDAFAPRDTTWADGGVFTAERPGGVFRIVDLGDAFVVPPFGDAHLHAFYDAASMAYQDSLLVSRGVLSVLNPHVPAAERESVRLIPTLVERAYAVAGISAPGSHLATASEARALGLQAWDVWGPRGDEIRASRLREGDAYFLAATITDLDAVWPRLLASGTDVVKVVLNHIEDLGTGDARPSLSPEVLNDITRRARADGLRVVAHVETAADLSAALDAGVDALAHLPGYGVTDGDPRADPASPFVMSDALVARLAASDVPVTPTLARGPLTVRYIPAASRPDSAALAGVRAFHRDLLRRLQTAGVALAVGADSGGLWAWDEAAYWVEIGGLTAEEALRAWTETTPRMVFPDRAVGALAPGFEASLLALACDPTDDFACTGRVVRREKQGTPVGPPVPRLNPDAAPTAYLGGLWYDAGTFAPRDTTWAEHGVFVAERPAGRLNRALRVVHLGDRYVVPPFADAHVHRIEGFWALGGAVKDHLDAGTFYVKNVNNIARYARMITDDVNRPGGIDVAFSHGGITAPGAHPFPLYRRLAESVYRDLNPDALDGVAAWGFGSVEDLERRWPDLLAERPDHVKLLLLDHEAGTGLRPDVFRRAVALAHQAGLTTTVHVLTAADLALAVDAGADEAAHLPGFTHERAPDAYRISDALAAAMAERGVVTVATTSVAAGIDPPNLAAVEALQAENVRRLLSAGAFVAIGTDGFGTSGIDEAENLVRIGAMDAAQAVHALVQTGPVSIFPGRAIGRLAPGFEASLLALACDPTAALSCARRIAYRAKQGVPLDSSLTDAETTARWRALDVATFAAPPAPADGDLLRGLKALADGDDAAEAALLRARATVADSLRPFVSDRLADAAESRFDWSAAVRYRTEASDGDAATSTEAGFARFPAARLAMDVSETTVPLDRVAVPAAVNGAPVRAIVDSGSPGSGISRALVERLGLRVDTTARGVSVIPSMNLRFDTYAVLIDSVRIGDATLYNVPATVGWSEPQPDAGTNEEIFLGSDVLRHLVGAVRYGYADSTFTLVRDAPRTDAPPMWLVEPGTGAPALPVRVAGRDAVAVVDTGNLASVYLAAGVFALPDESAEDVLTGDRADGGTWRVALHRLPFQIPGHPDAGHLAYEADYIFTAADPVTVLLGAPVWAGGTLTLDYGNRRIEWAPVGAQGDE